MSFGLHLERNLKFILLEYFYQGKEQMDYSEIEKSCLKYCSRSAAGNCFEPTTAEFCCTLRNHSQSLVRPTNHDQKLVANLSKYQVQPS